MIHSLVAGSLIIIAAWMLLTLLALLGLTLGARALGDVIAKKGRG